MTGRRGEGWTEEDEQTLRRMGNADASAALIAAKLKRTIDSVNRRARHMGVRLKTIRAQRLILKQSLDATDR